MEILVIFDQYRIEHQAVPAPGLCIPYGSGPKPIYKSKVGKIVYQNLINQATDFVYITTPYLIIDYDLTEDIKKCSYAWCRCTNSYPLYTR